MCLTGIEYNLNRRGIKSGIDYYEMGVTSRSTMSRICSRYVSAHLSSLVFSLFSVVWHKHSANTTKLERPKATLANAGRKRLSEESIHRTTRVLELLISYQQCCAWEPIPAKMLPLTKSR